MNHDTSTNITGRTHLYHLSGFSIHLHLMVISLQGQAKPFLCVSITASEDAHQKEVIITKEPFSLDPTNQKISGGLQWSTGVLH